MDPQSTGIVSQVLDALEETLSFYHSISCQCAFPRYRQYVSIDCVDTGDSYQLRETETLIHCSQKYFDITSLSPTGAASLYTCKKCGSTFDYGWSDFSIHVSRSYLKLIILKTKDAGADPLIPVPAVLGPYGHSYPHDMFKQVDLPDLIKYLRELK